jgi:hypothetical protein
LAKDSLERTEAIRSHETAAEVQVVQAKAQWSLAAAQLASAKAQVEQAKVNLEHHALPAPFAGVVAQVPTRAWRHSGAGRPLFALEATDTLTLDTPVTPAQAAGLALGTKVRVSSQPPPPTKNAREGYDALAAVRKAGPRRLRPILMTSEAMILGMLPMLGWGMGSEFRAPMAIAASVTVVAGAGWSVVPPSGECSRRRRACGPCGAAVRVRQSPSARCAAPQAHSPSRATKPPTPANGTSHSEVAVIGGVRGEGADCSLSPTACNSLRQPYGDFMAMMVTCSSSRSWR